MKEKGSLESGLVNKMIKKKVVLDKDITIKGVANAYKELI